MRVRVVFNEGRGASDEAIRLLFLFGYWSQYHRVLPYADSNDIAVVDWQPDGVMVLAPDDVALGTMLLVIEWRNQPVIELHARILSGLELEAIPWSPDSPYPPIIHPFFAGMPEAYVQGLAALPRVAAILPESENEIDQTGR